jgi:hypothetical protein
MRSGRLHYFLYGNADEMGAIEMVSIPLKVLYRVVRGIFRLIGKLLNWAWKIALPVICLWILVSLIRWMWVNPLF